MIFFFSFLALVGGKTELGFGAGDMAAGQASIIPKRPGASCSALRPTLLSLESFPEVFLASWWKAKMEPISAPHEVSGPLSPPVMKACLLAQAALTKPGT